MQVSGRAAPCGQLKDSLACSSVASVESPALVELWSLLLVLAPCSYFRLSTSAKSPEVIGQSTRAGGQARAGGRALCRWIVLPPACRPAAAALALSARSLCRWTVVLAVCSPAAQAAHLSHAAVQALAPSPSRAPLLQGACGVNKAASYPTKKDTTNPPVYDICGYFGWSECPPKSQCVCAFSFFELFCLHWGCEKAAAEPQAS